MTDKKSYVPRNWEVIKLSEEIRRYVIKGDDCAGLELRNQIINGEDLVEALYSLKSEIIDGYEQKVEKKEDGQTDKLINNLEGIIKGKEGTIVDKFKKIIDEYKIGTTYNQNL
ncbi:MAG TPA: hypothetical protein VJA20_02555 [Candidatus Nanoarchaeia archaeon]|nr:hypothetical protein [Candidatus Nanoarchaeia archaeon]